MSSTNTDQCSGVPAASTALDSPAPSSKISQPEQHQAIDVATAPSTAGQDVGNIPELVALIVEHAFCSSVCSGNASAPKADFMYRGTFTPVMVNSLWFRESTRLLWDFARLPNDLARVDTRARRQMYADMIFHACYKEKSALIGLTHGLTFPSLRVLELSLTQVKKLHNFFILEASQVQEVVIRDDFRRLWCSLSREDLKRLKADYPLMQILYVADNLPLPVEEAKDVISDVQLYSCYVDSDYDETDCDDTDYEDYDETDYEDDDESDYEDHDESDYDDYSWVDCLTGYY